MNCETFGKQFAAWLETTWDVENPGDGEMPSRLVQHTESCASCAAKLRRASEIVGLSRTETEQSPFLATRITAKIALQAGGHAANVKSGLRRFVMRAALPAAALLIVALSALLFFPDKGQTGNTVLIKFSLAVPGAEQVHVVGDWNGWDPAANPLQDGDGDGVWETEIELVPGEEYRYQFFIDDKTWMADPTAPLRIDDGFGGTNSVLSILVEEKSMKNMARITAVLILALICAGVWGQDADDTIFVQNIIRAAERLRWDALETGALERNLLMYRWEHLTGVDPEVMALALSYGKDQGIENPAQQARVAHQLAESIQEMAGAGLSSRESARAVLQGMRDAGPGAPDFEGRLREHVRMQLEDAEGQTLRRRAEKRAGRAGSGDTWNPPAPKGRPGGGREDIPAGPGDGPGPGGPSGQQKGR